MLFFSKKLVGAILPQNFRGRPDFNRPQLDLVGGTVTIAKDITGPMIKEVYHAREYFNRVTFSVTAPAGATAVIKVYGRHRDSSVRTELLGVKNGVASQTLDLTGGTSSSFDIVGVWDFFTAEVVSIGAGERIATISFKTN